MLLVHSLTVKLKMRTSTVIKYKADKADFLPVWSCHYATKYTEPQRFMLYMCMLELDKEQKYTMH